MAMTCPVDLDVATLRDEIQRVYGRVATALEPEFHQSALRNIDLWTR